MPYCSQCGNEVADTHLYCARCGARQPVPTTPTVQAAGLSPRAASILCYVPFIGWIGAIAVLASQKFRQNHTVRFNAFQGLYLFVAWLIADWVLGPFFRTIPGVRLPLDMLFKLAVFAIWIFMLVKTSQEETISLPILGELAERSMTES